MQRVKEAYFPNTDTLNTEQQKIFNDEMSAVGAQYYFTDPSTLNQLAHTKPGLANNLYNVFNTMKQKLTGTYSKELNTAINTLGKALTEKQNAYQGSFDNANAGMQLSKGISVDNNNVIYDSDLINDSFLCKYDDTGNKSFEAKIRVLFKEKYKGTYLNIGYPYDAYVNKRTVDEYVYPVNRRMNQDARSAKYQVSNDLQKLMSTAKYYQTVEDQGKHPEATGGWDLFKVTFGIDNKGSVNYYDAIVNVITTNNGPIFYDLTRIKKNSRSTYSSMTVSPTGNLNISDTTKKSNGKALTEKQNAYQGSFDNANNETLYSKGIIDQIKKSLRMHSIRQQENSRTFQDSFMKQRIICFLPVTQLLQGRIQMVISNMVLMQRN